MKIPRVPPHTNTSYEPSILSARSDEVNKLGIVETICWGSCTTAIYAYYYIRRLPIHHTHEVVSFPNE